MSQENGKQKMTATKAIMAYFAQGEEARKPGLQEIKALSREERAELGALCAAELGMEIEAAK